MVPAREWLAAPRAACRPSAPDSHAAAHLHASPPRAAPPRLPARARLGRRRRRTSSSATSWSRIPAAASGTRRRRTATPASPRGGTSTCGATTIARGRSSRGCATSTSSRDPAGPSGAPEGPADLRRQPRAQSVPAAGDGASARQPRRQRLRLPGRRRGPRAIRARGAPRDDGSGSGDAFARRRLRSRSRDPAARRARVGPSGGRLAPGAAPPEATGRAVITREDSARARDRRGGARRTDSCCSPTRSIRAGPRGWTASPRRSIAPTYSVRGIAAAEGPARGPFHVRGAGLHARPAITLLALSMLLVWARRRRLRGPPASGSVSAATR